jgi:cyclopropane fatty-acyl-phospholipid synthase-like methyltransferase
VTDRIEDQLMAHYQDRKCWYGKNRFQDFAEFFSIEAGRAKVTPGSRLLEIGFGEGLFLDWARDAGCHITGVEINPDFVALARQRHHRVFLGQAPQVLETDPDRFDGIFLFDVLEHLGLQEIADLLSFLKTVLSDDGHILVRVPNGASPFGRYLQHGDATHKSVITAPMLMDIARVCDLQVSAAYNGARSLQSGRHRSRFLKKTAYMARDLVQWIIGYLYYGENIPLDPQLTVVIRHRR